jgi:hypothetical protein
MAILKGNHFVVIYRRSQSFELPQNEKSLEDVRQPNGQKRKDLKYVIVYYWMSKTKRKTIDSAINGIGGLTIFILFVRNH